MDQAPTATVRQRPKTDHPRPRRFTADEYHRMAEAGILRSDERVELIEGEILEMPAIGGPHISAVIRLVRVLAPLVAGRADLSVQSSVRLDDGSEPQPDLALLMPRDDNDETTPTQDKVLLLVEVADTSAEHDRGKKRPLYARNGIPELWIVDLHARMLEVCRGPTADGYALVKVAEAGSRIGIAMLPAVEVPVDRIVRQRA